MNKGAQTHTYDDQGNQLNPIRKTLIWVQCKENRCLAYYDEKGKLINFYTGKKLTDFVKVIG